jgi:tetratricopeptide (TPR) repeat protein
LSYIDPATQAGMEASIWNNLGISYELTENFTAAIDAYLKSLDFALTQGDSVSIYQSYLNLGLLYAKVTDFGQSEQQVFAQRLSWWNSWTTFQAWLGCTMIICFIS